MDILTWVRDCERDVDFDLLERLTELLSLVGYEDWVGNVMCDELHEQI
jgi:hypothetical protein